MVSIRSVSLLTRIGIGCALFLASPTGKAHAQARVMPAIRMPAAPLRSAFPPSGAMVARPQAIPGAAPGFFHTLSGYNTGLAYTNGVLLNNPWATGFGGPFHSSIYASPLTNIFGYPGSLFPSAFGYPFGYSQTNPYLGY